MNKTFSLAAVAAFGLEGAVSAEIKRLGIKNVQPGNGLVRFQGSLLDAWRCNLLLRYTDRIYIIMAEKNCVTFEELFQMVISVPWEHYLLGTESINVSAQCARSRLMSPRDCQSITKKAILERLHRTTGRSVFPENGSAFPVHVQIHTNTAKILLDTSGSSLSRRGYRTWNGEAPLRETLAAALVEFSPWRPGMPLYDPCCGTGTLLIEAALRQGHIAPGINRDFAMSHFSFSAKDDFSAIHDQIEEDCRPERIHSIAGSDIDPNAISLAKKHVAQAHLDQRIQLSVLPLCEVSLKEENGVFLCNPPYGERIGDRETCRALYHDLRLLQDRHPTWSLCAISSDPGFEKAYGRKADKKRRLYNGRLECQFYTYRPRIN